MLLLAQTELPEYGDIAELQDKQKVYIASEEHASRKYIANLLKKNFTVVDSPDDAEFYLLYEVKASTESLGVRYHYQRSEMIAYTLKGDRKRILWADDETFEPRKGFGARNEYNLIKNFLKALKDAKALPPDRR